ncbi:MAG: exodeoxyribonuclease III [Gammaproteobacteria bacterium]|nr:exodeoxyribonuclease III [Gammaproteobacteria bacterium]
MKIATWNVNSMRVRLPHVRGWLAEQRPDVLGLQEIKMPTEDFPQADIEEAGYRSVAYGQRTYNGVALLSREEPADVGVGLPNFPDEQRRVIAATYGEVRIINLYVPNGQSVDSEKFVYKLAWLEALREYLAEQLEQYPQLAVMGDFNIAPDDRDVHDPDAWRGKVLCSDAEREHLQSLLSLGLTDVFRLFEQPEGTFSWWDYRAAAFRRKMGLRIDLILVSSKLASSCSASSVDIEPRKLERPSDHAPVFAVFE